MKKILLLNILFLISSMTYGYTMYSTSSYLHSRNTNVAYTQTYNTYNNTGVYRTPRIGYSTYKGTYKPVEHEYYGNTLSYGSNDVYSTNETYGQPRRAQGDHTEHYSGSETSDDGTVTVVWSVEGRDYFGIGGYYWIYVDGQLVDEGYMWASTAKNEAAKKAKEIANERAYSVPIGEPIIPTTLLLLSYIGYKTLKRKRK